MNKKIVSVVIILNFLLFNAYFVYAKYVYTSGEAIGVKLYTDGLIVVGISDDFVQLSGEKLKKGDIITQINGEKLTDNTDIQKNITKEKTTLDIQRDNNHFQITASPTITDGSPKLGLWLRDSTAGIGTITYFDPETNTFGALGHGITDVDTGMLMKVKNGTITPCSVSDVTKSCRGSIGELNCEFKNNNYGSLLINSDCGIYGNINEAFPIQLYKKTEIKTDITEGEASVLCTVDENGIKEYSAKILKVHANRKDTKGLVIEITDDSLIEKTGGIVQGMSGSPILQNGKLVGAITHVFVNDPTKGYGIFIENMLSQVN